MLKNIFFIIHRLSYKLIDIRAFYYSKLFKNCGNKFKCFGVINIKSPENIVVGENVTVNDGAYLNGLGGIEIGHNVSISALSMIVSTGLDMESFLVEKKHFRQKICIGDNVQIGAGAIILPGVKIGSNVIIGAGSIVTKNIENNSVVVGVPAKIIKKLTNKGLVK